ncbi:MAG: FKBP-type peptidyl-prolyl cis-trans isomerase [Myxococcota bacterium]
MRRAAVDDPRPFDVSDRLPSAEGDISREGSRKPARPLPDAPGAVPEGAWVDLESGLWVWDAAPGAGTRVLRGRVVAVDYTIWLEDGTRAFSTFERRRPVRFVAGAGGVIAGIEEAVRPMRPGGRRQVRVPAELAYGARGRGAIPPDADLRVEIELRDVLVPREAPPEGLAFDRVGPGVERAVLAEGEGQPLGGSRRSVLDYAMWVEGGDSEPVAQSYDSVEPLTASRKLLPGWSRGMRGMRPGAHFVLRIAPSLAFGADGRPPTIPPDATILVEVSLLDVRR